MNVLGVALHWKPGPWISQPVEQKTLDQYAVHLPLWVLLVRAGPASLTQEEGQRSSVVMGLGTTGL
jgi:hypothetical protein